MPDHLILHNLDVDELRAKIVADLESTLRSVLQETSGPRLDDRTQMAQLLGVSVPTLDRHVSEGLIPSVLIGSRRLFEARKVVDALTIAVKKKGAAE